MAAICSRVVSCICKGRIGVAGSYGNFFKRYLRVDPEEEMERQFITESFDERVSRLKVLSTDPTFIGRDRRILSRHTLSEAPSSSENIGVFKRDPLAEPVGLSLQDVHEDYLKENYTDHAVLLLQHYHVFQDLFRENIAFYPDSDVNFRVAYPIENNMVIEVCNGNKLQAADTNKVPILSYNGSTDKKYSIFLINLDGYIDSQTRFLHWFAVNMLGQDITSGTSCEYLQALPFRGTGFHRYVFLLLEHSKPIPGHLLPNIDKQVLASRNFNFSEFYNTLKADVTPVGIRFFQSDWDASVRQTFHHVLDMPEPSYEYDFPEQKKKVQVKYAHKMPFQTYLDQYRDRKEISEEVLKEHLSEITPFKPIEEQTLPYPLARPTKPGLYADQLPPTWIQKNLKHKVNKTGKYQYINMDC